MDRSPAVLRLSTSEGVKSFDVTVSVSDVGEPVAPDYFEFSSEKPITIYGMTIELKNGVFLADPTSYCLVWGESLRYNLSLSASSL